MSKEMASTEETIPQGSLRDLYYVLFRYKWRIIVFFLVVILITAVGVVLTPNVYLSEAKLLVRLGRENVTLDPTAATGTIVPVRPSHESVINTELEILGSQEVAGMAVDSIGAEVLSYKEHPVNSPTGKTIAKIKRPVYILARRIRQLRTRSGATASSDKRDKALRMVMDNFEIQTQKVGSTISLFYKSQNPELAQEVLTKLIESYLEKHIAVYQTPGSHQFFTQQSDHLRGKLTQLEDELRNMRNETGISSLEQQQRVILEHISALENDKNGAEITLAAATATVDALQKALAEMPDTVVLTITEGYPNAAADGMRQRLYDLQLEEQDLLSKYKPASRYVQDIRQQIAAAEALLSQEKPERKQLTKGLNATYVELQSALLSEQASISSLRAQVETLTAKLASTREELGALNDVEVKVKALAREIEIQEANYRKYSENLEQARIDDALETEKISNISIVQAATLPVMPVNSRNKLTLLLGLVFGIFGGVGLAFFSEYTDHSIKTPRQAEEKLGLSTLTCIPYVPTFSVSREARIKGYHEALDVLEEQLLLSTRGTKKLRVLAITGSHRHEGVSAITANLATSLAKLGQGDVLLIDANLRNPSVHQTFKTKLSPGLVETLSNGNNGGAVTSSKVHNLDILSAGSTKRSLSEILNSDEFRKLLVSMKKAYRFIILDLPAVNEASWTVRLAGLCDGVCLVVE
ncbi:MAG: Wzz/FepE/Etk N-terminal domain-containing protein, partial [Planctomycetota bacterium]|nr:Wzz/FepE/Etk N-terminal domain-containing protein [Planctomycetota bacterium]